MRVFGLSATGWTVTLALVATAAPAVPAWADGVVNIYSSRHYDTDERLYEEFEDRTGIEVRRVEDNGGALMARIEAMGRNSPADLFITTDAGRLWQAEEAGLFQPIESDVLDERVPDHLRHPDGLWFGFSTRVRAIFYDKERIDPSQIETYMDLADPEWEGMVCARSSSNIYMLSLMAAMIEHHGREKALEWAKGLKANLARDPEGGDTDQLRAIVSGQCAIAIGNTYYYTRAFRTEVRGLDTDEARDKIGVIFPNQDSWGTHVNISGGGVLEHAPNRENAIRFLEYLTSESAQRYFSEGNDEYPVVEGVEVPERIARLGNFERDDLDLTVLGKNQAAAQAVWDAAGYE